MLHKLRTGDILLAKYNDGNQTMPYLISYDEVDGYSLVCLVCGRKVGSYGTNKNLLKEDIKGFLNVEQIVPKESFVNFLNKEFKPKLEIKNHDILSEYELGIEVEI